MITIFACPKPFRGHFNVIQRNAIKSWGLLSPKPEIILVGEDEGVSEICVEFNLVHIREIEKNEFGTPLVNSIFEICQQRAKHPILCYVNSDIIPMSNFMSSIATVNARLTRYLMIGRRWDVDIEREVDFESDSWAEELERLRIESGILRAENAIDYFVFPRGMYSDIPRFAIGRLAWDNWLVWKARSSHIPVVEATLAATILHQNHDYAASVIQKVDARFLAPNSAAETGKVRRLWDTWVKIGPEVQRNDTLITPGARQFGMWAATWILDRQGVLRRRPFSLNPTHLKYQLKFVVPMYWHGFGKLIEWLTRARKAMRRRERPFFESRA